MKPLLTVLMLLLPLCVRSEDSPEKKTTMEVELDPYYASIGLYRSLTGRPIPHMGAVPETEIYSELIKIFTNPARLCSKPASIRSHTPGRLSANISRNFNISP
ncbi:MAG: hypothetical protein WCW52_01870 [Elusimicrobiales bacterium]|jgi:hypothetical protein